MDRRTAVAWAASMVLPGCGGGGGSAGVTAVGGNTPPASVAPAPAASAAAASASPAPAVTRNIAAWGDSQTPPFARNLQLLYPDRVVFDGGISGQTSTPIAARQMADTSGRNTWINVFWYGQNNVRDPERIKADIAASVAALAPGNARFLVLSVVNQATADQSRGGRDYDAIIQVNSDLAARYPQNFFDVRAYLISQFDPANAQDRADVQNDVLPSSLRLPSDIVHLNNNGAMLVAKKVKELIDARGW